MANEQNNKEQETYKPYANRPFAATQEYLKRRFFPNKIEGARTVLNALTRETPTRTLDDIVSHYGHGLLNALSGIKQIRQETKPVEKKPVTSLVAQQSKPQFSSSMKDIGSGSSENLKPKQPVSTIQPNKNSVAPTKTFSDLRSSPKTTKDIGFGQSPAAKSQNQPPQRTALPAPQKKLPAPLK